MQNIPEPKGGISWNDLKDKPFYTETETILEYTVPAGANGEHDLPYFDNISVGEVVFVHLTDGVNEITHEFMVDGDENVRVIGNVSEGVIVITEVDNHRSYLSDANFFVGMKITIYRDFSKKLDAKYVPGVVIEDISNKLVNGHFDFIAAGVGMYFSSKLVYFRYKKRNANFEETGVATTTGDGLFFVSFTNTGAWRVVEISTFTTYSVFPNTVYDGTYDVCQYPQFIMAGTEEA